MLVVATTFKLLAEIALFAFVGQLILGLLAGEGKNTNPFYRVMQLVGKPWMLAARWLSPRVVLDRHLPLVAVLLHRQTLWALEAAVLGSWVRNATSTRLVSRARFGKIGRAHV